MNNKRNLVTSLIIGTTFVLAGVGIFTALRLYQLRGQAVAPNAPQSRLFAWDCSQYTFNVSQTGDVTVENKSDRTEPEQQVDILIDNAKVATLTVPGFGPRSPQTNIGHVDVPLSGNFSWKAVGSLDCQNQGTHTKDQNVCSALQTTPNSGNWNFTPSFTTKNTSSSPVTFHWYLDCESRQENVGKPAFSSCKNSEGDVTLQPGESINKGLGAICLTWQYDIKCGGSDSGYVVEPQSCATPTSSSSPTPTSSSSPTPTATSTATPLPNLCSLDFSLTSSTATPTSSSSPTPTSSSSPTPTATSTSTPTSTATSTPTTSPTSTATSTPRASSTSTPKGGVGGANVSPTPVTLPAAGIGLPSLTLIAGGALLTIIAIVIAL